MEKTYIQRSCLCQCLPRPPSKATSTQKYLEPNKRWLLQYSYYSGSEFLNWRNYGEDNHQCWALVLLTVYEYICIFCVKTLTFSLMIHFVIPKLCTSSDDKKCELTCFRRSCLLVRLGGSSPVLQCEACTCRHRFRTPSACVADPLKSPNNQIQ